MINILCPPQMLKLGRKGENEFRTIEFDVAPWLADYPNGSISVVYMRPDGVVYPPEVSTVNGVTSWVITSVDTAAAGAGYAEIRLIDGDVVGKSARINTMVYLAINGTEIVPPAPDWTVVAAQIMAMIGNLDALTTEVKSNLVAAINELVAGGGGGGTTDHRELTNRDADNQHPISAITGLVAALATKGTYSKPTNGIPYADLAAAVKESLDKADSALQSVPVSSVNGKTGAVNLVPSDLGIGSVFTLKGSKPTYADLPATGNTIGDVWYVVADSVGYIWLNDGTVDRWEQLGMEIDLSAYRTASAQDVIDSGKEATANRLGAINPSADSIATGKYYSASAVSAFLDKLIPHYVSAHSWGVGDYCTFSGTIYKCNTAHSNVQWTSAYWDAVPDFSKDIVDNYAKKSDLDDYVAISQGVAEAGKFLVVGDDGNVTTMTLAVWEGGSYGS